VTVGGPHIGRSLTPGEWDALSEGLADALDAADVRPEIVAAPSGLARIVAVWRGRAPIMALGERIFWPSAPEDCSAPGREPDMAILQHELQHVLEFATGELGPLRYALNPRNWVYRYRLVPGRLWLDYGAEQRATIVEDLWRLEHGFKVAEGPDEAARRRALIPWAK
jgi:hypothetical protein